MLHIDGSFGEGGGQILRTALALSVLTQKPFQAVNIRKHRTKPGLKHQHLCCIDALKRLADAGVERAHLGSESIAFYPGRVTPGRIELDIGTAGSIPLLLQSILLPSIFSNGTVGFRIIGGTDTRWSMSLDYFAQVILPHFKAAAQIQLHGVRRGFYPKGQGLLDLTLRPRLPVSTPGDALKEAACGYRGLPEIDLVKPVDIAQVRGVSIASRPLERNQVAQRQARGAEQHIGSRWPVSIQTVYTDTASMGTVITLWAESETGKAAHGACALGARGVPAEKVGKDAAERLMERVDSGAGLDHHLADNLIPLLALAGGRMKPDRITGHILSNIYVCEAFLDVRFQVDPVTRQIQAEGKKEKP